MLPPIEHTDQRCVWMRAGVLTYRLCDRSFDCDYCPLDIVLRKTEAPRSSAGIPHTGIPVRCALPETDTDIAGLLQRYTTSTLSGDLSYSRSHVWLRNFDDRLAILGVDTFLADRLPAQVSIVVAACNTVLTRGAPFAWLYAANSVIPLPSPIAGVIVRQNPAIDEDGVVLRSAPYDLGWLVTVHPTEPEAGTDLLPPSDAALLFRHDMERYVARAARTLNAQRGPDGPCLNDGGTPVASLEEALGGTAFSALIASFFPPH
jgi:glycine cleavage system H lipoate-binding protein